MKITPLTLKCANEFVAAHHRHHGPVVGARFSVGLTVDGVLRGVAIAGRPVARHEDAETTIEVNRLCTDGRKNACSMLYAAVTRAAAAMGFVRAITYTLADEGGASLRASGWQMIGRVRAESWGRPSRSRVSTHPTCAKLKWEKMLRRLEP